MVDAPTWAESCAYLKNHADRLLEAAADAVLDEFSL
jgi:hypothetical protein